MSLVGISFKNVPSNFQNANLPLLVPPTMTSWESAATVKKSSLKGESSFFSVSHWFLSIILIWVFAGMAIWEPFGCHPMIKERKVGWSFSTKHSDLYSKMQTTSLPIWPGVELLQTSLDLSQQSFHVLRHVSDSIFHIFTDPSQDAEAANSALGSSATDKSGARWPSNLKKIKKEWYDLWNTF